MPLIECTLGATTQSILGLEYKFERDRFNRFVATVHNLDHVKLFLAVEHYREVGAEPVPEDLSPAAPVPEAPEAAPVGLGETEQEDEVDQQPEAGEIEQEPKLDEAASAQEALAKFDHDGDGRPGGSKPRRKK